MGSGTDSGGIITREPDELMEDEELTFYALSLLLLFPPRGNDYGARGKCRSQDISNRRFAVHWLPGRVRPTLRFETPLALRKEERREKREKERERESERGRRREGKG